MTLHQQLILSQPPIIEIYFIEYSIQQIANSLALKINILYLKINKVQKTVCLKICWSIREAPECNFPLPIYSSPGRCLSNDILTKHQKEVKSKIRFSTRVFFTPSHVNVLKVVFISILQHFHASRTLLEFFSLN